VIELGVALALLVALVGGAALLTYAPWDWLFGGGVMLAILGLALGVPTGFWYHVRLYRAVRPGGPVPRMWWLRPDRLHDRIAATARAHVMRPFYWGAVGFVLSIVGCLLLAYGAWKAPPG